jgi:hypothetical protein
MAEWQKHLCHYFSVGNFIAYVQQYNTGILRCTLLLELYVINTPFEIGTGNSSNTGRYLHYSNQSGSVENKEMSQKIFLEKHKVWHADGIFP